jgi:mono/diheme cytochrome c family protein
MIRILVTVAFSTCAIFAMACSDTSTTNVAVNTNAPRANNASIPSPLPSATIDELASGRKIYAASCANCHKENGTGGEVTIEGKTLDPEDLTSAKLKKFSDEKILGYIANGIEDEGMPAFKGKLSEGEMRDVLKFIRVELQKMPPAAAPKS